MSLQIQYNAIIYITNFIKYYTWYMGDIEYSNPLDSRNEFGQGRVGSPSLWGYVTYVSFPAAARYSPLL